MKDDKAWNEWWDRTWEPDTAYDEYEWSRRHGKLQPRKRKQSSEGQHSTAFIIVVVCILITLLILAINFPWVWIPFIIMLFIA